MSKRPYDDPQWRRVRQRVLDRDGHECRIRGDRCEHQRPGDGCGTHADHIIPWEAGGSWFDEGNLRAACGSCNKGRAARQKHRGGWRRSSTRVVLVVGPPGAGKSSHVAEHAGARDLVIDYDVLAEALGGNGHGAGNHEATSAARNAVLRRLQRGEVDAPTAWIVSANPRAEEMFPHHEVMTVDPGREEVLRRCEEAGRPGRWRRLVDEWYEARRSGSRVGPSRDW